VALLETCSKLRRFGDYLLPRDSKRGPTTKTLKLNKFIKERKKKKKNE